MLTIMSSLIRFNLQQYEKPIKNQIQRIENEMVCDEQEQMHKIEYKAITHRRFLAKIRQIDHIGNEKMKNELEEHFFAIPLWPVFCG